jgi:hypothetical protein
VLQTEIVFLDVFGQNFSPVAANMASKEFLRLLAGFFNRSQCVETQATARKPHETAMPVTDSSPPSLQFPLALRRSRCGGRIRRCGMDCCVLNHPNKSMYWLKVVFDVCLQRIYARRRYPQGHRFVFVLKR